MKHIFGLIGWTAAGVLTASTALAELVVFDWAGYEDPEFYASYTAKHGAGPTFAFFGDEEEAFQKLRAGFKADLAHPCSQSVVKWREAGLLEPLDTSKIAEWDSVIEGFRDMPGFSDGGQQYVLPLDWGATAMTYRTDLVTEEESSSLQSFADPKWQGRISIGDNVDDAYALGFLAIGVTDWTTATDEQFKAASDFLRKVHKNVRAYWQDGATLAQLMASGEVALAWAWNETTAQMQAEGHPVEMKRDTQEGSSTWVCGYVKLKGGEGSEEEMYDFLNAWLEPRTAEYIVSAWGYGHSNGVAMNAIDTETLQATGFDDLDRYKANTLWQAPVPSALREKMIAEFERIKAGF
ncbi:Spermidine/putrescine-binding periplasmic protein [Defluviimonas aquaemixtae]|uniref:Spermidine/putrescine-binding periplasmic protein n=1 Tax=Albidovulum aquaemixtae TaxID=1542388 RepID=A0A2R8B3R6_9RHOB|nr:extracellular solute-binding protein [Defluviimonas aquaemixtae]SPH17264.1 Spermidine/putrescine-binding periplasmic protein [Defluviimonas aquaemixtae]